MEEYLIVFSKKSMEIILLYLMALSKKSMETILEELMRKSILAYLMVLIT